MAAWIHDIVSRAKKHEAARTAFDDFSLSDGTLVDPGFIATDRSWSPYCFDAESRKALFVELPKDIDLGQSAFAYVTQFQSARRAVAVDFDDLAELAHLAPRPKTTVMVYSIGRCGSTLVSKIFAKLPKVWSVSEPDVLTNLAAQSSTLNTAEFGQLVQVALRLSYRPPDINDADIFVVKPRSAQVFEYENMFQALPDAKNMFLLRDAIGWTASAYQFAQKQGFPIEDTPQDVLEMLWNAISNGTSQQRLFALLNTDTFPTQLEDILAACWLVTTEKCKEAAQAAGHENIFTYDGLNNDRENTVRRILALCGFGPEHVAAAMTAYDTHSQAGTASTSTTPAQPLDTHQKARIRDLTAPFAHLAQI
ncbi:MAG: hypothetical protein ACSHXD_11355 [Marinosulfonomonas sp.]